MFKCVKYHTRLARVVVLYVYVKSMKSLKYGSLRFYDILTYCNQVQHFLWASKLFLAPVFVAYYPKHFCFASKRTDLFFQLGKGSKALLQRLQLEGCSPCKIFHSHRRWGPYKSLLVEWWLSKGLKAPTTSTLLTIKNLGSWPSN